MLKGATARATKPRLSITLHGLAMQGDLRAAAEKMGAFYSLSAEQIMESPHFPVGDKSAVVETLVELYESFGFTRFNLSGMMVQEAAPLVRELGRGGAARGSMGPSVTAAGSSPAAQLLSRSRSRLARPS